MNTVLVTAWYSQRITFRLHLWPSEIESFKLIDSHMNIVVRSVDSNGRALLF